MNVLFIITGLGVGGAEMQVCSLADELANSGNSVAVCALAGESLVRPRNPKVDVIELRMRKSPLGFLRALMLARRLVAGRHWNVVHSHMFHANIFSRILRIFAPISNLVCTAHSTDEGGMHRMLLYRITNFLSDFNSNVSQDAVNAFVKRGAFRKGGQFVVPNGIDCSKFYYNESSRVRTRAELGISAHEFLFLAVGRLEDQKDYPNLLRAFAKLVQSRSDVVLAIAGDGRQRSALEILITELSLTKRVSLLGLREDIPTLMSSADAFVLSSKHEGFGMVLAEAMATERMVLTTDCGGTAEVVGDCGVVVPPKNTQLLYEGMLKCIFTPESERRILGSRARKSILDRYSLTSIARRWLLIYRDRL